MTKPQILELISNALSAHCPIKGMIVANGDELLSITIDTISVNPNSNNNG